MDVQLIDFADPSGIRTLAKDGRHGRLDRNQRAGEEVDHDGS
jgi:hypothetical protein